MGYDTAASGILNNFTIVFDGDNTDGLFSDTIKPLLDFKILQGVSSIFIIYGQCGSHKLFTLIGEKGHLCGLEILLKYVLDNENVEHIKLASIKAYGIKASKICFLI